MSLGIRSLAALVPLAVLPVFRPAAVVPFVDGYTVTYQTTGGEANAPATITMKFAADKMRFEFDIASMMGRGGGGGGRGDMGPMFAGAFMLVQGAGKVAIVVPGMRMGFAMDVGAMAGRGGGAPVICSAQTTVDDLGAAETIAGHPTHKYRIHSKTATGEDLTEAWLATDITGAEDAFFRMGESMPGGGSKCIGDVIKAKSIKGFPVKFTTTANGKSTTMEATRAEKSNFDASEFEIPPGINIMDGAGMMGGGRRGGGY
jgi:hypothetical protein